MALQGRHRRRFNLCYYWTNKSEEECIEYALDGRIGPPNNNAGQSNYGQAKSMIGIGKNVSDELMKSRYQFFLPYIVILGLGVLAYYKLKW